MTSKAILYKRLCVALSKTITKSDFTWFFGYFCEREHRDDLRHAKTLSEPDVLHFSRFCGYDLRFPIPLPLWAEK